MGGSASKDITFSDLESSVNNKNNDSKNKNTKENQANSQKNLGSQKASKNLKNSANKNKSSGNTKNMEQIEEKESENNKEEDENENEEDEENENEEKEEENDEEDEEKEEEKTKKNEDKDKDKGEQTDKKEDDKINKEEETANKEEVNNNKREETNKKEESNIKEEKTEKNEDDKNNGEETEKKEVKETQEKKDNENKEGEGEGEDEEYTNQDDEISNIKSFLENEKKKKVKGERLNIPRQPKNGEKFLEGNIVYKKIEKPESIKEQSQENEEEEEKDDSKLDEVEKLKKKKMLREYDFYLTKEINKNKFVNKNKDSNLPMDFATKVENKNQVRTYLCFVEAKTKKKKKIEIKPNKDNLLIRDEIYLFNERRKQIKSIKPLTQEEFIQPYSYKVEFEMGKKGISNKVENKTSTHDNFEYLDVYPNGEAYKFKPNDSIDEKEEEPVKVKVENAMDIKETINTAQVEENQKKDENDIVNIINKGLQENKLVEEEKKAENANDF